MDIIARLAQELGIKTGQAQAAVELIDEGNTIPFIARYRKEATGSLNDEVLRTLDERLKYLRGLDERREQVMASIRAQDKLTAELESEIQAAMTLVALEDLYRPYRPKRRTRATIAKEKGLEGLADLIGGERIREPLLQAAARYVSAQKGVESAEEAVNGAKDILAERVSDEAGYREYIRRVTKREGILISQAKDAAVKSVYENYYQYEERLNRIPGHRVLAINRGENEKILTVKIEAPQEKIVRYLEKQLIRRNNPQTAQALKEVAQDSYSRLIAPAIERELRSDLTGTAEEGAVRVFGKNLQQLLMQPPIVGKTVLGWDPAFRTGCKLAVVDETGKVLKTTVIFPLAPQNRMEESKTVLKDLITRYGIDLISLGNGTASRESEQVISALLKEISRPVRYVIVNEAGASVYSASKLGAEEFPEYDVGYRSAISIARRLQDPLSELVKIDPKSIGVGQYQHDLNQKRLSEVLEGVVEDCVNRVGVDLNTASAPLLSHVSGVSKTLAKNIVAYREENGSFRNRRQLLKVAKLGPKAFEQCAGFMRISGGDNPLDATGVHPESYEAAGKLLKEIDLPPQVLSGGGIPDVSKRIRDYKATAARLGIGEPTLRDIVGELEKPGRDPREEMPRPVLRSDILTMEDLKCGMVLKGTVRNVIDFGVFVDIGVHQDGLVHISQLSDRRVGHPLEVVSVGDIVDVKILGVDLEKKRISLSMKGVHSGN